MRLNALYDNGGNFCLVSDPFLQSATAAANSALVVMVF
jgi:hypothetical protein